MIHIAALNDYSGDGSEPVVETTKEAQEAEAYALYNKALELQRENLHQEAEVHYNRLLNTSLLTTAVAFEDGKPEEMLVQPGFMLKYSTYKNLAILAFQKNDKKTAMEFYLEAVNIDSTDVSLWYKIGHLALELVHVPLARIAFEQAHQCNPKHWPSLDNLCTVLFAMCDYPSCLYYIAKCFELDSCYPKGHVLRKKIYSEQPGLERDTFALFEQCDISSVFSEDIVEDQSQKILEEALDLRKKRETKKPAPTLVKFQKPLKTFTWKCVGECLASLYDYLEDDETLSFSCRLDLAGCLSKKADDKDALASQSLWEREETSKEFAKEKEDTDGMQFSSDDPATDVPMDTTPAIHTDPTTAIHTDPTTMVLSTPDIQRESHTTAMETDHDYASSISIEKSKRGPKRKRGPGEEPAAGKRRSARVRNTLTTNKKKEEVINYQTLLRGFLPSSLRNVDDIDESSQDSCIVSDGNRMSIAEPLNAQSSDSQQDRINFKCSEESDVRSLLETCLESNNGVIDVMTRYLVKLANDCTSKWPSSLAPVFICCYDKLRKHLQLPSVFCNDSSSECLSNFGNMVLVYVELKLDRCIEKISSMPASTTPKQCVKRFLLDLGSNFAGEFYHQDVTFTEQIATLPNVLSDNYLHYVIRVYWVKARFLVLDGNMEGALENFDVCSELLSSQKNDENGVTQPVVIKLPNCKHDDTISLEEISKKKKSLERTQSLEEVRRLFESGQYGKVSSILLPTLKQPLMVAKSSGEQKSSERPSQILLLLQSLLKQNEYQKCLTCAEIALIEAIHEINHARDMASKEEWIDGLIQVCIAIDRAIASESHAIKKLETSHLVRLTNNLIRIIEIAMETEIGEMGQVSTVYPWILLYRLIKHEEDQIESMKIVVTDDSTSPTNRPCLPSSLMLLLTAHEYLGRRSWCCNDKGALLKLHISVLEVELYDAHPFKSDLEHALEQSFYCLYSHPNRKAKARHLSDHAVDELPLLWDDTRFLFNYFKPKILPEFDSYKTSTMSSELESLLLKISRIIPAQENPANTIETVQAYLDGATDTVPCIPPDKPVKLHVVQELYYLLADYYFKNKEWGKAIKFYLHDLCVSPERFDSWAGMAMARSTRLELKINSCDSKSEGPIYKQGSSAARCFERAFQIDSSNSTLWMEYGSLSYMMHSYSSRQLKQQQNTLSAETKEFLTNKKTQMLKQAKKCYETASGCDGDVEEEEWLIHYMLGKIAEKEQSLPHVYLDHYKLAAMSLHENEARYPKKIPYHNPPDLALESLEVFFRIHASILKLLEFADKGTVIDYKLLKGYVSEARQLPFARGLEKRAEGRDCSTSDTDTEAKPMNAKRHHHMSSVVHSTVQQLIDHDYFETGKKKARTASQESTDTASDLDFFSSGDEPMSPRFTDSNSFQGVIRSSKAADAPFLLPGSPKTADVPFLLTGFSNKNPTTVLPDKDQFPETGTSGQEHADAVRRDTHVSTEDAIKKGQPQATATVDNSMKPPDILETDKCSDSTTATTMTEGSPSIEKSADGTRNDSADLNNKTVDSFVSCDDAMEVGSNVRGIPSDRSMLSDVADQTAITDRHLQVVLHPLSMQYSNIATEISSDSAELSAAITAVSEDSSSVMDVTEGDGSNKHTIDASKCEMSLPTTDSTVQDTVATITTTSSTLQDTVAVTGSTVHDTVNPTGSTVQNTVTTTESMAQDTVKTTAQDTVATTAQDTVKTTETTAQDTVKTTESTAHDTVATTESTAQDTVKITESTAHDTVATTAQDTVKTTETTAQDTVKTTESTAHDTVATTESTAQDTVKTDSTVHQDTVATIDSTVHQDTGATIDSIVHQGTVAIDTDTVTHSTCGAQTICKDKDSYKADREVSDIGAIAGSSQELDAGSVEMLDADKEPVSDLPYRSKQKHNVCKPHGTQGHISSFQMAFLMSSLFNSEESTEESGHSQSESEDLSESHVSVKEPTGTEDITDHCSIVQQSKDTVDMEDVQVTHNNEKTSQAAEISTSPHDHQETKCHQVVENVSGACKQPVAVSGVLRNLQREYRSSGESQSDEEIQIARTDDVKHLKRKEEQGPSYDKEDKRRKEKIYTEGKVKEVCVDDDNVRKGELAKDSSNVIMIDKEVKEIIPSERDEDCEMMETDEKEDIENNVTSNNENIKTITSKEIDMDMIDERDDIEILNEKMNKEGSKQYTQESERSDEQNTKTKRLKLKEINMETTAEKDKKRNNEEVNKECIKTKGIITKEIKVILQKIDIKGKYNEEISMDFTNPYIPDDIKVDVQRTSSNVDDSKKTLEEEVKRTSLFVEDSKKAMAAEVERTSSNADDSENTLKPNVECTSSNVNDSKKTVGAKVERTSSNADDSKNFMEAEVERTSSNADDSKNTLEANLEGTSSNVDDSKKKITEAKVERTSSNVDDSKKTMGAEVERTSSNVDDSKKTMGAEVERTSSNADDSKKTMGAEVEHTSSNVDDSKKTMGAEVEHTSSNVDDSKKTMEAEMEHTSSNVDDSKKTMGAEMEHTSSNVDDSKKTMGEEVEHTSSNVDDSKKTMGAEMEHTSSNVDDSKKTMGAEVERTSSNVDDSNKTMGAEVERTSSNVDDSKKTMEAEVERTSSNVDDSKKTMGAEVEHTSSNVDDSKKTMEAEVERTSSNDDVSKKTMGAEIERTSSNVDDSKKTVDAEVERTSSNVNDGNKTVKTDVECTSSNIDDGKKTMEGGQQDRRKCDEHVQLINECIMGLKLCLSRFSQHYKALYRMAHVYHYVATHKNDQWSRDILLGSSTPWNQMAHLAAPALFVDANKTKNFFHGIWRIPVEEIDRSGSFPSHMYRAIYLLIDVLLQLKDHQMLLQLSVKLNRTPELNKKYLRDYDRQYLSTQSYDKCLVVLKEMIGMYKSGAQHQQRMVMMFVYRANQVRQNKLQITATSTNSLLVEAFQILKGHKVDNEPGVLEQAVRYCATIDGMKLSNTLDSSSVPSKIAKESPKPDGSYAFRASDSTTSTTPSTSEGYNTMSTTPSTSEVYKTMSTTPSTSEIYKTMSTTPSTSEIYKTMPTTPSTSEVYKTMPTTPSTSEVYKTMSTTPSTSEIYKIMSTTPSTSEVYKTMSTTPSTSEIYKTMSTTPSTSEVYKTMSTTPSTSKVYNTMSTTPSSSEVYKTMSTIASTSKTSDTIYSSIAVSQSRGSTTFADQFKHFANQFQQGYSTVKTTKRVLNLGQEDRKLKKPLLQICDEDLGTNLLDKRSSDSKFATKDTSVSLKASQSTSGLTTSPPKATVGTNLSQSSSVVTTTSPPKDSVGSGLTIPFRRIALGGGQNIKASIGGSIRQSDARKPTEGSSGIHARVLPFLSDEEKQKLKTSLSQIE